MGSSCCPSICLFFQSTYLILVKFVYQANKIVVSTGSVREAEVICYQISPKTFQKVGT
jgi:hypothetical protein